MNNGVLLVNKEKGMTSRDVVNILNKKFNTKKIGHTGTLDPLATGVLIVCINEATKLCEMLTSSTKEYIAQIKLGIKTDTLDITGNILEEKVVPKYSKELIKEVLDSFLGDSIQEVPIYSAVKVNGKKLYEYARNNEKVELPKRTINISNIELLDYKDDIIEFKVTVSKGTYIRSLINDICLKLNTIGCMKSLVRSKQGEYFLEECYTLKQIENNEYNILSVKDVLKDFEQIKINEEEYLKIKNGSIIPNIYFQDLVVFLYQEKVIAIYKTYEKDKSKMKPYKMFNN